MENTEKRKALEAALSQIEKQFGKGSVMKLGDFSAMNVEAKAIIAYTNTGDTARMVSRFRPPVDIIGLSVSEKTWRTLALSWGIIPMICSVLPEMEGLFQIAKNLAKSQLN